MTNSTGRSEGVDLVGTIHLQKIDSTDLIPSHRTAKRYYKPVLQELGNLRSLTLGASAGWDESVGTVWVDTNGFVP